MPGTIKTKSQLYSDSLGLPNPITRAALIAHLDNMVASYEDIFQDLTTAQRDLLTPSQSDIIFNTDTKRLEMFNGLEWVDVSSVEQLLIDCSANPDYPQGIVKDFYYVTVAGKIGGASGKSVYVGDIILAVAENPGGDEASVGGSWKVVHSQGSTDTPVFYAEATLTSPQILALNGTPISVIAAPGAGKVLIPISVVWAYTFNSIAYITNTGISIKHNGLAGDGTGIGSIAGTANLLYVGTPAVGMPALANAALMVLAQTGNPAAGDGTAKIGVYYKIHTV